ncbi:MAG: dTDP-4-dehydrorhamnose reductase [Parabacteroides sp.]|nr:dTDP-4-dehydrorhamnose reductase [Parabacteroides sp.]
MKNILVTGANGQLGNELQLLASENPTYRFFFTDVDTLDICNREAVTAFVSENRMDYILNCAAYTAVDKAEDQAALCEKINSDAVRNLGEAAAATGARVIHVSTDYVFDGTRHTPYAETDPTCPRSVYGHTKLAGEKALLAACPDSVIIRTAWLYSVYGNNFVKTMLRLGKERDEIKVVFDQVGTPTYAADLADAILAVVNQAEAGDFRPGIYHFSNEGVCSWYDFTVSILKAAGIEGCRVTPIETKDYPAKAERPHYSVLNKAKIKSAYALTIPHWEASLAKCLEKLNK